MISKNIETIYKQLREENPEGRIFVAAHSLGGALAKTLLQKYPDDKYIRVDGFNSAPSAVSHKDERYFSYTSSFDPVSMLEDNQVFPDQRFHTNTD